MFICEYCDKNFTHTQSLQRHKRLSCKNAAKRLKTNHISSSGKFCELCKYVVPLQSYAGHVRSSKHRSHACNNLEPNIEIINSAFQKRIISYRFTSKENTLDVKQFFAYIKDNVLRLIKLEVNKHTNLKLNFELFGLYVIEAKELTEEKSFQTKNYIVTISSNLEDIYNDCHDIIDQKMSEFQERDSGWTLLKILYLEVNINKYNPLRASSYIPLPNQIVKKRAVLNIRNMDQHCFAYCLVAALFDAKGNVNNPNSYPHYSTIFNFDGILFPVKLSDIALFEKNNEHISVTVYGLESTYNNNKTTFEVVGPLYYTNNKKLMHANLLLISDDYGNNHYCLIKNFSRLLSSQLSRHDGAKHFCDRCLQYFTDYTKLQLHAQNDCSNICSKLPTTNLKVNKYGQEIPENILQFENFHTQLKIPFVVYADFESLLKPISKENNVSTDPNKPYTIKLFEHEPYSFAYYIKCDYDDSLSKFKIYRGANPGQLFIQNLETDIKRIYHNYLKKVVEMLPLTDDDWYTYNNSSICHICNELIKENDVKVKDHCHLTGKFRNVAHSICNLNYKVPKFIPCFFHNLNYDAKMFIKVLALKKENISVIAQNKEKYISFTKDILVDNVDNQDIFIKIKFLDSFRFLSSSLKQLSDNLTSDECKEVRKYFTNDEQFKYIRQKGVFPYSYVTNFEKLNETSLPSKENFYDTFNDESIDEKDYERACKVWDLFQCQTIGDYSDVYLKSDVLLLADVFETFRNISLNNYKLDPSHYITSPSLSWDAMLKYTKVKLELITDIDMLHFFKRGIRGGVSMCVGREALANNKFLANYDKTKPTSYIIYLDATNLYGYAMMQYLPYGGFEWLCQDEIQQLDILQISDTSPDGYVFEIDLEYPKKLHYEHNDFPFCPENAVPPGGKYVKLLPNLCDKQNYIIHYRNLKQCLENGLIIKKIHRVLKFKQSDWLKTYIDLNTNLRNLSNNEAARSTFKNANNSVYGKTMENIENRVDIKLSTHWENDGKKIGAANMIAKPHFKNSSTFTENLVAIQMNKLKHFYNKPIYVGFSILDISKTVIYDFYYNFLKIYYGPNVSLLYTDTDSLILKIYTENVYDDIKYNLHRFDTSNFKPSNIHNIPVNTSILGNMKDEYKGDVISSFYGTGAKAYCIQVGTKIDKKAKGISKNVVKNKIKLEHYQSIARENKKNLFVDLKIFKSYLHNMYTELKHKVALSHKDDKRFLIPHSTNTLAWGHHDISIYQGNCPENYLDLLLEIVEELDNK